ncbi:hypothetical protein LINGRAHAP2_LOCUS10444 [Linum grandiflorum]
MLPICNPDIIGRLSGVTRPTPSPAGGLFFKLLLDHASGERFTILYSRFRPPTPVDLSSIAVLERRHPIICILTAVTVTNPGGFHICMYPSGCCIQGENTLHFSAASYRISLFVSSA